MTSLSKASTPASCDGEPGQLGREREGWVDARREREGKPWPTVLEAMEHMQVASKTVMERQEKD